MDTSEFVILIDEAEMVQIDVADVYDRSIKQDRKVLRLAVSVKHAELPRRGTTPLTDPLTIHDQLLETPGLSKAKRLDEKESAPSVSTDLGKVADRLRGGAERDIRRGEPKARRGGCRIVSQSQERSGTCNQVKSLVTCGIR